MQQSGFAAHCAERVEHIIIAAQFDRNILLRQRLHAMHPEMLIDATIEIKG